MTDACAALREALFLGHPVGPDATGHLATCAVCRGEAGALRRVSATLAAAPAPPVAPALRALVLASAGPLLVRNARRTARHAVARAIAAALVPLPLIVLLDVWLVRTAHALLARVLPEALSLWVVGNYAVLLAFLLAVTYVAVPILAARQVRPVLEESHA